MMPLISESVRESLIQQISHELYNSNFYMRVGAFLQSKGLKNMAKFFENQIKEEREHADIVYKLLTDLGDDFQVPEVDAVSIDFSSLPVLAEAYLQREMETTISLKEIMDMAAEENSAGCSVVQARMLSMIKKQQSELDEASTFYQKVSIIGDDWKTALLLDAGME